MSRNTGAMVAPAVTGLLLLLHTAHGRPGNPIGTRSGVAPLHRRPQLISLRYQRIFTLVGAHSHSSR